MDQELLTLLRRVDTPTVLNAMEVVQGFVAQIAPGIHLVNPA